MPLSKNDLLNKLRERQPETKTVTVAGYGDIELTELTAAQKITFGLSMVDDNGNPNPDAAPDALIRTVAMALQLSPAETKYLQNNGDLVMALLPHVTAMNGLNGDAVKNG